MSNEQITLQIALTEKDLTDGISFIEAQMRRSFGCDPPPTNGVIFLARMQEEIVGSIVIQGIGENGRFPIEDHYLFDEDKTSIPFRRSLMVQGSRWIAIKPHISLALLRASFAHAYSLGKRYMLIEAKPYSIDRLAELGVICEEIKGAKIVPEKILATVGHQGMKYFTELPLPTLYLLELNQFTHAPISTQA